MGQFASRAFDGDPYIEIMRQLPDKELCWWIQKVIWLAEGFTVVEHFRRTYPQLMMHKCQHCNGAGTVICPHCHGYKIQRATSHNGFRLSQQTQVGRLLATAGSQECHHCGEYCPWDAESEWQGMHDEWERKLAYYNRSYGQVMDNWYEDVVNEGNLDEDTPQEEEPAPPPEVKGLFPDLDRAAEKMPQRLQALMKRYGGHPYETYDMIPYQILDPTRPLEENVDRLGMDYNWLPPELDPQGFPEYLLEANNPIRQFEHQIRMEYLLLNNLDAAIKDQPKPANFGPSAGTVLCPECNGHPHTLSFMPNAAKLFNIEPPFWLRTLTRMDALGTLDVSAQAYRQRHRGYLGTAAVQEEEELEAAAAAEGAAAATAAAQGLRLRTGGRAGASAASVSLDDASTSGSRWQYGEVPTQPYKDVAIQEALDSAGRLTGYTASTVPGAQGVDQQDYGPLDPLSYDPYRSRADGELLAADALSKGNPITGSGPAEASWLYHNLNPAKNLARKVRDLRHLGPAPTGTKGGKKGKGSQQGQPDEERTQVAEWLSGRDSVAADLQGPVFEAAGPVGSRA